MPVPNPPEDEWSRSPRGGGDRSMPRGPTPPRHTAGDPTRPLPATSAAPPSPPPPPPSGWRQLLKQPAALVFGGIALLLVAGTAAVIIAFNRTPAENTAAPGPGDSAGVSASASDQASAETTPSATPTPETTTTPGPRPSTSRPATGPAPGPPAPGQSKCVASPSSCGLPDASNTGVPAGVSLTVVNGDVTLDQAGAVLENRDIRGCVTVSAGGVTIKNSRITGGCNYVVQTVGSLDSAGSSRLTIQDSEISCNGQPHNGIGDNNVNLLRVEISKCENGMDIDNRFLVQDSYVHDLVTCCEAHTDGAQLNAQGTDIRFIHNSIISAAPGGTSAIIMHTEAGNSHVLVQNNLLAGGAYILYCPRVPSTDIRVVGNRFGPAGEGSGGAAYGATDACGGIAEFANNIWDANGNPVTS